METDQNQSTPVERMEQQLIKINQKLAFIVGVILVAVLLTVCGVGIQLFGGW